MESIVKELDIDNKNIFPTSSPNLFTVVVHNNWLKKWLKNTDVDSSVNNVDFALQPGEDVPYPWRKTFIRVIHKKISKVLPLPRYKLNENSSGNPLTFSQLLQYVSQANQRNLWKECYKKYGHSGESLRESTIVNLLEHDQLLSEVILRLYGCSVIRVRTDNAGTVEYKEIPNKYKLKSYDTHVNLMAALFALETDNNFFIVYRGHYGHNLLDCLNFSPALIDKNYCRGLFVLHQILNVAKTVNDRGLSIGSLQLQDIYLTENLWIQVLPTVTNNIHSLDASLICEYNGGKQWLGASHVRGGSVKVVEECGRSMMVQLEKLCLLWVNGRISNLDYLLHLNMLAGRSPSDPQAHFMVPWVTDFASRCGRNWRDLSKSKYRLNKGDRQLDMTYEVSPSSDQIPHHVSDALSDITCYVYLARRTPKDVLCKYVRNKWVPAEYPASIQRLQEWTPDECIPEFYTDPTVFKSVHEDLPDLGIPSWATCVEDFITKHREALESAHVSENLHHWIDITFGYKLSGQAAVKAKNVCLSLVSASEAMRRGAPMRLLAAPHPPKRAHRPIGPQMLRFTDRKSAKPDSSDEISEDDDESSCQHVSRLHVPSQRVRSRHKSSSRARSLSKHQHIDDHSQNRASSHSRQYRVQRSELGKGVIYLPKDFNPISSIQALETLDNFRTKCFFTKTDDKVTNVRDTASSLNLFPMQQEVKESSVTSKDSDDTAFTNHMFLASYDQNYLRKFTQDSHIESVLKERKNRTFNTRYTTDAAVYKQFVIESRKQDMLVIGCLIVEIFLHTYMRPLRTNSDNFIERYNSCRTVLKYNFSALPKCVSYIASLLLNVQSPTLSFKNDLTMKTKDEPLKKIVITDKGLPPPTSSQLLQPLLMQHLIPFPQNFNILHKLLSTLHEYELTSNELNILFMYECDGVQCEKYEQIDKTKLYFSQRIAEGKIQACTSHLETLLGQLSNEFNVLDIFVTHYIELLKSKDTCVLAAWYLFDTVSKALGPAETRHKLLKHIINLYEDDDAMYGRHDQHIITDADGDTTTFNGKEKFVKLYHNIFLLQLMVRLGLQCFLENFTQHLVEAVGGYKVTTDVGTPGHSCHSKSITKKLRYSDDNLKNALSTASDIFSPDTSYGSEQITPSVEKNVEIVEVHESKEKDCDNRSENEVFHFESDKERLPSRSSRSKSPAESIVSYNSNPQDNILSPSPLSENYSPTSSKYVTASTSRISNDSNAVAKEDSEKITTSTKGPMSPTIDIPTKPMFTSYLHFADDSKDDVPTTNESHYRQIKSLELNPNMEDNAASTRFDEFSKDPCKISDMSSESLIWLAHRLGPVLTCRYITRNLLKMLTLCYVGKDNLAPLEDEDKDEFEEIAIVNSRVVGDRNAMKVINCLISMVEMYGEQLIIFQYLPHMGELIASCHKRLTSPLEGGVVACLQLLRYLVPYMTDVKLMEQLQDTFLKTIIQPAIRLSASSRCVCPSGCRARRGIARKALAALHGLALRLGPEVTRRHVAQPALMRFFLAFDKAVGVTSNWPATDLAPSSPAESGFLELRRDGSTAEWRVRDGLVCRSDLPDLAASPPEPSTHIPHSTAQEELRMVFDEELAYHSYTTFEKFIGTESMERCLKNIDTIRTLCQAYKDKLRISTPLSNQDKRVPPSLSDEPLNRKSIDIPKQEVPIDHISCSNSFGSNVTLVGNRIDVVTVVEHESQGYGFDVVAYKMDNGVRSNRHLRGDWLIYWEHEIGRADKDTRFNLKQIKLQTFVGHTHSVKAIHCLDNENSFMSGSKDKTVRLWSLRNQGDGNATSQCNWTYTGHKKGVLSLSFLESLRLAVSTDSVVHIWDPFMESVVCQLDNIKVPVSIVLSLRGPSPLVVAATTDATVKLIDARAPHCTYDLKLPVSSSFIRCICVVSDSVVCCGLASGHVTSLDVRRGAPITVWKAHDSEVLRLAVVDEHRIISSGLDQVTALWRVDDGELIAHLKGNTEPVHCLSVYNNELISGTTNNRIGVHTSLDQDASFSSTKLRNDTLRGVLTCMSVLPLNRLLLLGSDNGSISLLC